MINKTCPKCGKQFEGRANKLYCSHNCKMSAFYEMNGKNELTVNQLSVNDSEIHKEPPPTPKPLTVSKMKTVTEMVTVPVQFTIPEKEMLEEQAEECDTVLPKFIRIRSLMDETDTMSMQQMITEQRDQLEDLRVKLSFFQGQPKKTETVKRLTDKSVNGLLIKLNNKELDFLTELYIESQCADSNIDEEDIENWQGEDELYLHDEREEIEQEEIENPGSLLARLQDDLITTFIFDAMQTLNEYYKKKNINKKTITFYRDYQRLSEE